ncbi:unnamed protein product, partial [Rotaria magnacalcarata]
LPPPSIEDSKIGEKRDRSRSSKFQKNTTAGSTRILGYVIFVIALFAVPLLIKRGVEYLIDMKASQFL